MRRLSFNDMAQTPSILSAERSPAATVAITVLCLLGVVQLGTLAKTAWRTFVPAPPVAAAPVAPALPAMPSPGLATASGLPPLPDLGQTALPPLPALPVTTGLPPLPVPAMQAAPAPRPPVSSASLPAPTVDLPPVVPQPALPTPSVATAPAPVAPRSKTGNPQVDELIDVAIDSRALEDMPGALQALERAELLLPDHPVVLREKALTLGRMGREAQAQALWERAKYMVGGNAAPAANAAPHRSAAPLPLSSAQEGLSPLVLGECRVEPDPTVTTGQKLVVKVPVRSQPGATIDPSAMNLDVFFYDRVDGSRVENTKADTPVFSFDMPVDFASGEEIITVVYHMPKLSPQEEAEIGRREFHGFVVKLYYQQKLVSTAAEPRGLLTQSGAAAGTLPPPAP